MGIDATAASFVSACTALVASVLGPLVTLRVARRQIHASVVSVNRQKWIDSFRDLVAAYTAQVAVGLTVRDRMLRDGRIDLGESEALAARLEGIVATGAKIHLMIDPDDAMHRELVGLIDEVGRKLRPEFAVADVEAEINATLRQAVELTRTILRREWTRTKRGL